VLRRSGATGGFGRVLGVLVTTCAEQLAAGLRCEGCMTTKWV